MQNGKKFEHFKEAFPALVLIHYLVLVGSQKG